MAKKPVLLCIMDGFGWVPNETYGNAVVAANTAHLDALMAKYPMTTIDASGMAVGLPDGQMGNCEVGHTNMGAGRIVYQQLTLITKSIQDGEMLKNPVLVKNMKAAIDAGKAMHLMGLVATGGVHSHARPLFGVLEMAKQHGRKRTFICTASWTAATPTPTPARAIQLTCRPSWTSWASARSPPSWAVTTPWTATTLGPREEGLRRMLVYGKGKQAADTVQAMQESYDADVTDEFICPSSPARTAVCRKATWSSSSTTVTTAPGDDPHLLLDAVHGMPEDGMHTTPASTMSA